jgi:odorant receptor
MYLLMTLISMELDNLKLIYFDLRCKTASEVDAKLRKLIKNHVALIDCSRRVEEIFSPLFLFSFVQSSVVVSLLAVSSSTSIEPLKLIFNVSYCAAMLNQIWLLCFFGQKVIDSSEKVAEGAYESGWEDQKVKTRRSLVQVMMRGQQPVKLTAMNFKTISLKSFTAVRIIEKSSHILASLS